MKGLILTAKHHDGFCLWPSRLTEHSVRTSHWRDGQADVVREFVDACRREGLQAGLYLSPWDRNHAEYGRPAYLDYYQGQLRELLTGYGPLFEVWFDGANGGDGYYGGAREKRTIDGATYYQWPKTWGIVRELQPQAVMFSDAGPDVRWVGNENGLGFETTWMGLDRRDLYPGAPGYEKLAPGQPDAADWVPPEVDVSIRPGWFYHAAEDAKVKTVRELVEIYYASVGRSANLLLNVPPDRRGLFHETDVDRLRGLRAYLDATFAKDLARGAKATADAVRGSARRSSRRPARRTATRRPTGRPTTASRPARCSSSLPRRHASTRCACARRSRSASASRAGRSTPRSAGAWKTLAEGTTVGVRRILRFEPVTASRVRLRVTRARACPAIAEVSLFLEAPLP